MRTSAEAEVMANIAISAPATAAHRVLPTIIHFSPRPHRPCANSACSREKAKHFYGGSLSFSLSAYLPRARRARQSSGGRHSAQTRTLHRRRQDAESCGAKRQSMRGKPGRSLAAAGTSLLARPFFFQRDDVFFEG